MTHKFHDVQVVRTTRALPAGNESGGWPAAAIEKGTLGTVVDLLGKAETGYCYMVEFIDDEGCVIALHCVDEADLAPMQ
ncbi:DUF4926 domain-containing protein [Vandammella animalimorsus]|uniref:DUF4926 domain-containing protein n=1 Tax=Vandammella animalimorsus TaxID=2029117 RepID=A0A3M6RUK2_9BURK|nr:DUF4926 domain-containing protein [Vandammella animalimorsus]RMX19006.1 DUF4926 domain-containing protein [Vandammella animalimorsus]